MFLKILSFDEWQMEILCRTTLVQWSLFVVRGIDPSGAGCFLSGCEVFEKVVPIADERVAVEDFAVA